MNISRKKQILHEIIDEMNLRASNGFDCKYRRQFYEIDMMCIINLINNRYKDINISQEIGTTRVCIFGLDDKFVYKIPLFTIIDNICLQWKELQVYHQSKRKNIDSFFGKATLFDRYTTYITYYNHKDKKLTKALINIPIIQMEKAEVLSTGEWLSQSDEYSSIMEDSGESEVVEEIFYNEFKYDFVKELFDFLEEREVFDLHLGNIGYIGYDLKIIDYAM